MSLRWAIASSEPLASVEPGGEGEVRGCQAGGQEHLGQKTNDLGVRA